MGYAESVDAGGLDVGGGLLGLVVSVWPYGGCTPYGLPIIWGRLMFRM